MDCRGLIGLLTAFAFSSTAWAGATLQPVTPQVSVNKGHGYQQVATAINVSNGDQVMAGPGGHAKIVYPDGCVTDVQPGGVATVGKCYRPMRAGLEAPPEERPIPWFPILAIAGVTAGGLCAVMCGGEPRSP
jgi:hypothetical protein